MFSLLLPASGITSHPKDWPLDGLPHFRALFSPAHPLCSQFSLSTKRGCVFSCLRLPVPPQHVQIHKPGPYQPSVLPQRCSGHPTSPAPRRCPSISQHLCSSSSLLTNTPSWHLIHFPKSRLRPNATVLSQLNTSPQQINCSSSMSSQFFLFCVFLLGLSF